MTDGATVLGRPFWHPAVITATWFWSGLLPWVSGTWGSLAALPFGVAILHFLGPWALLGAAVLAFLGGWWASAVVLRGREEKDPGAIVVDEVAGQFIVLIAASLDWRHILAAFVLFRVADIVKPWPASWADRRVKGALGVMLDDIFAAIYALIILFALRQWWG